MSAQFLQELRGCWRRVCERRTFLPHEGAARLFADHDAQLIVWRRQRRSEKGVWVVWVLSGSLGWMQVPSTAAQQGIHPFMCLAWPELATDWTTVDFTLTNPTPPRRPSHDSRFVSLMPVFSRARNHVCGGSPVRYPVKLEQLLAAGECLMSLSGI